MIPKGTDMGFSIIGLILIGFGVGALFLIQKKKTRLFEIRSTQTSSIKELKDTCRAVCDDLGSSGAFRQAVEVKGVAKCDTPLAGEFSNMACVYFESVVRIQRKNSDGKWETHTVSSNSRRVNFFVEDGSDIIEVNPNSAAIDALQVYSRPQNGQVFTEKIVPIDRQIYVFGEASDSSGQLTIQAPSEPGKPFFISVKSEEELTITTQTEIKNLLIGVIVLWVIGVFLTWYGLTHS